MIDDHIVRPLSTLLEVGHSSIIDGTKVRGVYSLVQIVDQLVVDVAKGVSAQVRWFPREQPWI